MLDLKRQIIHKINIIPESTKKFIINNYLRITENTFKSNGKIFKPDKQIYKSLIFKSNEPLKCKYEN